MSTSPPPTTSATKSPPGKFNNASSSHPKSKPNLNLFRVRAIKEKTEEINLLSSNSSSSSSSAEETTEKYGLEAGLWNVSFSLLFSSSLLCFLFWGLLVYGRQGRKIFRRNLDTDVCREVIANACKVPTTFVSELTESEDPDECVKHSDEDQELEQLISGEICFKVYPFSSETHTSDTERRIILSGSFNPLHEGHLKLLEVATRNNCFELSRLLLRSSEPVLYQFATTVLNSTFSSSFVFKTLGTVVGVVIGGGLNHDPIFY
ncbi:hypothetical protein LOK49_LG10G01033, partial [Camellia lanceoleosa]